MAAFTSGAGPFLHTFHGHRNCFPVTVAAGLLVSWEIKFSCFYLWPKYRMKLVFLKWLL